MRTSVPQRNIIISLKSANDSHKAYYSYVSPVTGQSYQDAPVCDLKIEQASYSLFVLDYLTTANGWVIEKIETTPGSAMIVSVPGAYSLSALTYDPYTTDHVYRFTICYRNRLTGVLYCEDPQEGNGPP